MPRFINAELEPESELESQSDTEFITELKSNSSSE